jgi:uncharacterized protein (TIGR02466 family)
MTNIFTTHIHESVNEDMANYLLPISKKILKETNNNDNYPNGKTTFFNQNIVNNYTNELQPFYDYIFKSCTEYLNQMEIDKDKINLSLSSIWFSQMNEGGRHELHTHSPDSHISGNFYINAEKNSSDLIFYRQEYFNNILSDMPITNYNVYNSQTWNFKAKKGLILLWRSDLLHSVPLNKSKNRIAVSFNLLINKI